MTVDITAKIYTDKNKAREHLESVRWPDGAFCPHCGSFECRKLTGKSHRPGLYQCNACREQFTVTVGTVFERSKVPLNKWVLATHLLAASKKGMSAHQLHRMLGVTYKTAWFMAHRIREAMQDDGSPMGGDGKHVEADETFWSDKSKKDDNWEFLSGPHGGWVKTRQGRRDKWKVLTLVERDGRARSIKVETLTANEIRFHLVTNVDRKSTLQTDEANHYKRVGKEFAKHEAVQHQKDEYVRGTASTNTIEGFFSIFKRGMRGVYQHCGEQHLFRYLREFDFRYSHRKITDAERADIALKNIAGKRLTYRRTGEAAVA